MWLKRVLWSGAGVAALALLVFSGWIYSLPPAPAATAVTLPTPEETETVLAALRPPKRERPVIAVIGINDATETTDYLMPYGILRRADVADVVMLATDPGPVTLYPALKVEPDATVEAFDRQHPDGADYVIVPAMSRDDDPAVLDWIRSQAAKNAIVIGVCAGAKILAEAGLLDDKKATTHWYFLDEMLRRHPAIRYVADRRLVVDDGVVTTTGITASMPMSLTLVEAIAGRVRAGAVARDLGLAAWDARHDSGSFALTRPFALAVLGNVLSFWDREQLGIGLSPGFDEVSLALVADAWSRTYRSGTVTVADPAGAVISRNGVRVIPDADIRSWSGPFLTWREGGPAAIALDDTLEVIEERHGKRTADIVAMQLEYQR